MSASTAGTFRSTTKAVTDASRDPREAMSQRQLCIFPAAIAATTVIVALAAIAPAPARAEANRIVLRVNDRIATLYDYEVAKRDRLNELRRRQLPQEETERLRASLPVDTLRDLYEEMLVLSRADQLDIRLTPSELADAVERSKENFGISSDADYERALAQVGMTRESFRDQIEKNLRMREVFAKEVYSQVEVTEEDLRRYYGTHLEEFAEPSAVRLREIVVLDSGGLAEAEMTEIAGGLRQAMLDGAEAELLAEHQPAGRTTGWIELGWVTVEDLDEALAAALAALETGGVSEPTRARGGLHLLQVLERREAAVQEFAAVQEEIELQERDRRFQDKLAGYMADLEAAAYVLAYPPPEAAGFQGLTGASGAAGSDDPLDGPAGASVPESATEGR